MDPHNIVNELNLTHATISMVMMEDEKESSVLINNIQQVELGLSHVTINSGKVLSSNSEEGASSIQETDLTELVLHVYNLELNDRNVLTLT